MIATALLVSALTITGCPSSPPPISFASPREATEAFGRVEDNLNAIAGALFCKATLSVRFRDEGGTVRRFIAHPGVLVFEQPRCMILEIRSALGPVLGRVGSNDEYYWFWVDTPDLRKLWFGQWGLLTPSSRARFAIPPNELLDALFLRPLEEFARSGLQPLLERVGPQRWLLFQRLDARGRPYVRRAARLDSKPPHLPIEIIDYSVDGVVRMRSRLGAYKPIASDVAALIPHKYVIEWPASDAEFRMDLSSVGYRDSDLPFCDFPEDWSGERESLDAAPAFSIPRPASEKASL